MSKARTKLLIIRLISVGIVVTAVVAVCYITRSPFNDKLFDQVEWKRCKPQDRAHMAGDLVAHHLPKGTSSNDPKTKLGTPERVCLRVSSKLHSWAVRNIRVSNR